MNGDGFITGQELMEVTAKSIAAYYDTEKAFVAAPSPRTLHAYLATVERFTTLRDELRRACLTAEAFEAMKKNEGVKR